MGWLSPEDTDGHLKQITQCRANNTGQWILEEESFSQWESTSNSSVIWGHGDPGAGKTVLASSIIRHLQRHRGINPGAAVSLYFCSQLDRHLRDEEAVFISMIAQIWAQSDIVPPCLVRACQTARTYGRCTWLDADHTGDVLSASIKFSSTAPRKEVKDTADNSKACDFTLWGADNRPINGTCSIPFHSM